MPKSLRTITICLLLSIALYAPVAVYYVIVSTRNISYADAYEKKKIKVDSLWGAGHNAGDGAATIDSYHIYSKELHREFSFTDPRGSLLKERIVDDKIILDLYQYKEQHHDSIQIWYHPRSEIKYARDGESSVPMRDDSIILVINSILLIVAIFHIRWQIRYYKERKQRNSA
jgi:hypothetical protein